MERVSIPRFRLECRISNREVIETVFIEYFTIRCPETMMQCNKCKYRMPLLYIGKTKRKGQLNERFGEHRQSILNHRQLSDPTPVSFHFNHAGHPINDIILIPLKLIRSNRDLVRKAREDHHLIHKGNTLSPLGISRRNEAR